MARLKKRGESGAAKNFITRNQALKKLQVSLSDFRRLCILKGIHPQQPRHSKRANKGSTAPATFYYTKDIVYLAHEPILKSLRDHKAFAKKLSRAIGRREWSAAKNLEDAKPRYTLDHIIKERYPSFDEALGDIDDALCTIVLFANLPAKMYNLPEGVVDTCARLKREWDEYVVRTASLKKTFLSIKGVYFQAEIRGKEITWLVPYPFTQHVPHDVDFRVMSTFLELYTTLLGFVLFKLWADLGEEYPPKLDKAVGEPRQQEQGTSGQEQENNTASTSSASTSAPGLSKKAIRKTIRSIEQQGGAAETSVEEVDGAEENNTDALDAPSEFTTAARDGVDTLPTPSTAPSTRTLFKNCTFYLDRSTPLALLSFLLRSYGAMPTRIGWDEVLAPGSPLTSDDARITHVLIDRPEVGNKLPGRHYVQPQWVVDGANRGVLLDEGKYDVGKTLPPHMSPFVEGEEVPDEPMQDEEESESEEEEEDEEESTAATEDESDRPALKALLAQSSNATEAISQGLLDAAELEAESAGGEGEIERVRSLWEQASKKHKKKSAPAGATTMGDDADDEEARKMARGLLSNRQRKLYDKMSYTKKSKQDEQKRLQERRVQIRKEEKRKDKAGRK